VVSAGTPAEQPLNDLVRMLRESDEPLVVFMPRNPTEEEKKHLNELGRRAERTRIASSTAQLQDDLSLILHRPFENLPINAQAALQQLRRCDPLLSGRKVVVIDDDIRNIFSLTSALEEHGVDCIMQKGRSGIRILQRLLDADAPRLRRHLMLEWTYQTMQNRHAGL
jgi:hypothetical protein